jgi:recombination protein RecA
MYNEGISVPGDLLDTGVSLGVVAKNGNTFMFAQTKLGVGRENSKNFLKENKEIAVQLDKELHAKLLSGEAFEIKKADEEEEEE